MSTLASWTYLTTLTIWPVSGTDEFSQIIVGAPYSILGTWEEGGEIGISQGGEEFTSSSKYYFQQARGSANFPKEGDYIAIGNLKANLDPISAGAEKIQKVGGWDMAAFGSEELPDWKIMT
ncbi:MAG: hypothetical protein COA78_06975 [Blastopirellula sp.]|nr:MAG: hypothetical protein COA78_06975 [Blastopirellula sp.]